MKLGLGIKATLSQTLTPQQIQYLKLLQMPVLQLEAQVRQEIEMNPMLEEAGDELDDFKLEVIDESNSYDVSEEVYQKSEDVKDSNDYEMQKEYMADKAEPFEYHTMLWDAEPNSEYNPNYSPDDDDNDGFQIKDTPNFNEDLISQLRLLPITEEEFMIAKDILGNCDTDGYLRRDLDEILKEFNEHIAELNFEKSYNSQLNANGNGNGHNEIVNPALLYTLDEEALSHIENSDKILNGEFDEIADSFHEEEKEEHLLRYKQLNLDEAERVLKIVRHLDPAGIGSRNIQECLSAQLNLLPKLNAAQKLAKEIIVNHYESFAKKHYEVIKKQLEVGDEYLKEALEEIKRLNPRPGGLDYQSEMNTVIPDFYVGHDYEKDELIISVNDSRIPELTLSKAYENMRKEAEYKKFNKDTKDWLRTKKEDAKFLMQAIRQRKHTMLKVMTSIANKQQDFFEEGSSGLKPLIYKNIAEETSLDISTVCRIVNGKYVSTKFGTFELKYFFSESLPSDDGEDVSTKVIKDELKKIIDNESKQKPLSDDKLSAKLKEAGYNVARRTVAKYREQLNIPVARLRKELL